MPDSKSEMLISGLWDRLKEKAKGVGGLAAPGVNMDRLTPDEELAIWNRRAIPIEQEWEMWRAGKTPEEIGMAVFPDREKLVKSGGRIEPSQWFAYSMKMAQKAEAARQQGGQPPPDMGAADQQQQTPEALAGAPPLPSANGSA